MKKDTVFPFAQHIKQADRVSIMESGGTILEQNAPFC